MVQRGEARAATRHTRRARVRNFLRQTETRRGALHHRGAAIREEDGDDVLFKLLKKHGANFEAIDHGGNKPATLAAKAGRKKSKELLEEALVK